MFSKLESGAALDSPSLVAQTVFINPPDRAVVPIDNQAMQKPLSVLTPRERDVLRLLAEGKTSRGIADELCIGVRTVEAHRTQITAKLEIRSIAGLTKYAIRVGLSSL